MKTNICFKGASVAYSGVKEHLLRELLTLLQAQYLMPCMIHYVMPTQSCCQEAEPVFLSFSISLKSFQEGFMSTLGTHLGKTLVIDH